MENFRDKRQKKSIPIFSIIDSDDDLQDIIETSKFFINPDTELNDFILLGTGGSTLGAEALIEPLEKNNNINFHVIDNIIYFSSSNCDKLSITCLGW